LTVTNAHDKITFRPKNGQHLFFENWIAKDNETSLSKVDLHQ
jgi:hypothetical protein